MKPILFTKGKDNIAILRAVLPPDVGGACEMRPTGERSTLVSVARTHMIKHRAPIAILLDTETLDSAIIAETVQTTNHLMRSVAGDTPFEVVYCVPHLEAIFFEDSIDFQRIFPDFKSVFILQVPKSQPKQQLQVLFEKGRGPGKLDDFLSHLTSEEVAQMQSRNPIRQLISFITNNRESVLPGN